MWASQLFPENIVWSWERGEIATEYKLVLLLRLRENRKRKVKSQLQVPGHPNNYEQVKQGVEEEIISLDVRKIKITIDKVACNLPNDKNLMLLEGVPGVGESTFSLLELGEMKYCYKV